MIETQDTGPVRIGHLLEGRRLLITGATGFVGKVALSMLLERYPGIGRVYVLVRPGLSGTADERFFGKVLASPAFDPLRARHGNLEAWMREKCEPVAGDVTEPNLGLADDVVGRLVGGVDVILNSAGMVDFTPTLESSLKVNADGARNAAELAVRLGAALVHVSTCFAAGQREGHVFEDGRILGYYPKLPELGDDFDPAAEVEDGKKQVTEIKERASDRAVRAELRRLAVSRLEAEGRNPDDPHQLKVAIGRERKAYVNKTLVDAGAARAEVWGWQNTYCYTKSLGDQLIAAHAKRAGNLRYALVKPSVVESSLAYPFPGWNEGFTTCAPLMYLALRGHRTYPSTPGTILDVIPVDQVAAGLIAVTALACEGRQEEVYQLCTGDSNPLWMDRVIELTALARRQHYRNREVGSERVNRVLSRIEPLPRSKAVYDRVSVPAAKRVTDRLRRVIDRFEPTWGAPMVKGLLDDARKTLDRVDDFHAEREMLFELFMPFLTEAHYTFRADRMHRLVARMDPEDREKLAWDPGGIEWRDYWLGTHMQGLKKWVFPNLEEELEGRGRGRERPARDLLELLMLSVRRHAKHWALRRVVDGREERYTYQELGALSDRAAIHLATDARIAEGDRVLILSENRPEWPMAFFGILKTGAVSVPVDANASAAEVANLVRASGAAAVVLSDEVRERLGADLASALESHDAPARIVDLGSLFAPVPDGATVPAPRIRGDGLASLIFTSGTTGTPKGVMLTHRNFTSLVAKLSSVFELGPRDGVLSVLPLHHTFEFSCGLLTPIAQGAEITYLTELSADALSEALRGGRITAMVGVPALWQTLHRRIEQDIEGRGPWLRELLHGLMTLNREIREHTGMNLGRALFLPVHRRLGNIRFIVSGGSALSPDVLEAFHGMGFDLYEGYGLTEAAPVLTVSRPGEGMKAGSVGKPLPGIEVRIDAPDDSGVGEVLARGPNVMQGYFGDEDATRATLESGWLRTGDLGRLDDEGNLFLVGRQKDVIVDAGGKNIYPDEVEAIYESGPYLKELCVVGLPDADGRGERVACLAVPDLEAGEGDGLGPAEVRDRVRAHFREVSAELPLYRRVKVLHLWDGELPRTATRKVKRPMVVRELERLERVSRAGSKARKQATGGEAGSAWVAGVVAAVAQKEAGSIVGTDRLVDDLGLDSLGLTELASALEEAGIRLPETVENEMQTATVDDLQALVAAAPRAVPKVARRRPTLGEGDDLSVPDPVVKAGRRVLRLGQRALYERLLDVKVRGSEHIPLQGTVLVAANHSSHLDMGLVKHALGDQGERLSALAAKDYFFGNPIRRLYFGQFTNLLPMEREGSVRESLRLAGEALRRGHHLLIFPEGTRATDGVMKTFLPSVGYLALAQKVDVLPMYLSGTHESLPKGGTLPKREPLSATIGPVIAASDLHAWTRGLSRQDTYRLAAAIVEDGVRALMESRPRRTAEQIREALGVTPREETTRDAAAGAGDGDGTGDGTTASEAPGGDGPGALGDAERDG